MDAGKYFPEGIAIGDAFINRIEERKYLIDRIKSNKHTVLMAPRRYGKTSLITKVAQEMKIPYGSIDLLAAYSVEYVRDQLADKISRLAIELAPSLHKAKEKLIIIFKQMKPELSIGVLGHQLSLNLSRNPLQDITELLLKLDESATQFKKKAVIYIDEFQQISRLKNYHSIEASIRHAVERSYSVTYVFSGSNRQLLKQMFGEQGRPLYRLCQTINIERMLEDVYIENLHRLSKIKWKKVISNETIEKIFYYTELHPFYMNVLCQLLWEHEKIISPEEVDSTWRIYVKAQRHIISHDIMELSLNQRKVITALAKKPVKEIQSAEFTSALRISTSSVQQAIEVLTYKDLVYKNQENFFTVLDPAIKYYLNDILWGSV